MARQHRVVHRARGAHPFERVLVARAHEREQHQRLVQAQHGRVHAVQRLEHARDQAPLAARRGLRVLAARDQLEVLVPDDQVGVLMAYC